MNTKSQYYCCWLDLVIHRHPLLLVIMLFSNIASKASNNLLQIAHIPYSSFKTKLNSGHSRPAEDS